jgi:hypothetical protein
MVMRELIITTGTSRIIVDRWLPLLRTKGEYLGDVLCLDYGMLRYGLLEVKQTEYANKIDVDKRLQAEKNVKVIYPTNTYKNIFIDRMMKIREYLLKGNLYKKYDVIAIMDGNDAIFWGSIQPLLNEAKEKLCYVKEHFSNHLELWGDFEPRQFIKDNYFSIKDNPIINGGVIAGNTQSIMELLDFNRDMVEVYGDEASDQVFLNILIYYYNYPSKEMGYEWNYTHAIIGRDMGYKIPPRVPKFLNGKAYATEDNREIIIEHRTGTGWKYWNSDEGLAVLNGTGKISVTAEYDIPITELHFNGVKETRNWLFPKHKTVSKGSNFQPVGNSTWLFKHKKT